MAGRRRLTITSVACWIALSAPASAAMDPDSNDADFLSLLSDAVTALEVDDGAAYDIAAGSILASDLWYPEMTEQALAERDDALLVQIWLAVNADQNELLRLAIGTTTTERDSARAASAPDTMPSEAVGVVADADGAPPVGDTLEARRRSADESNVAILQVIRQRGILIPDTAVRVMQLNPPAPENPPPTVADFDAAIHDLALYVSGESETGDLDLVPAPAAPEPIDDTLPLGEAPRSAETGRRGIAMAPIALAVLAASAFVVALIRTRRHDEMAELAFRDCLTGLLNRRRLDSDMSEVGRRGPRPTAVLMVDVDHFKTVNDTHGHSVGDLVLSEVATVLSASVRSGDVAYRYGGEEFCVLLPDTSDAEAELVAERIRDNISRHRIDVGTTSPLSVTASVGVATGPSQHIDATFERADRALYLAKASGRNRLSMA